jgi:hypothetical protein
MDIGSYDGCRLRGWESRKNCTAEQCSAKILREFMPSDKLGIADGLLLLPPSSIIRPLAEPGFFSGRRAFRWWL